MRSILILGGTTEARLLADRLHGQGDVAVTLSLAGRTRAPAATSVAVISGGFGGEEGLTRWLADHRPDLLIDATHPFAAIMSTSAVGAATRTGVPLIALRRTGWTRQAGARWTEVDDAAGAIAALGPQPHRVFLALGRQQAHAAEAAPWHDYLVRSVEPIEPPLACPKVRYLLERGPFEEEAELTLLREHRIDVIVAKNSGGRASHGKIAAARSLGLEVVMIRRPRLPPARTVADVGEAIVAVRHVLGLAERGE